MEMWETILELTRSRPVILALQAATVGTLILLLVRGKIPIPAWRPGKWAKGGKTPRPLSHVQAEYGRRSGITSVSESSPGGTPSAPAAESPGELLCPKELTERIDRIAARVKTRSAGNRG